MFSKIREAGLGYSLQILFNRVIPCRLFRCRRFLILELPAPPPPAPLAAQDLIFRWAETPEEFQQARQLSGVQQLPSAPQVRLAIASINQQIIGVIWAAANIFSESELGLRYELREGDFWFFSTFVDHTHRRRGVYRSLLAFAASELRTERSTSRFWLAINPHNQRSMQAHLAMGVQPAAHAFSIRTTRLAKIRTTPCGDYHLESLRKGTWNCWKKPLLVKIP